MFKFSEWIRHPKKVLFEGRMSDSIMLRELCIESCMLHEQCIAYSLIGSGDGTHECLMYRFCPGIEESNEQDTQYNTYLLDSHATENMSTIDFERKLNESGKVFVYLFFLE